MADGSSRDIAVRRLYASTERWVRVVHTWRGYYIDSYFVQLELVCWSDLQTRFIRPDNVDTCSSVFIDVWKQISDKF